MSSTYMGTVYPPHCFNGSRPDRTPGQRTAAAAAATQEPAPAGLSHLSPSPAQYPSSSASPTFHAQSSSIESTPASLQYQSDFASDLCDDFYGVDFNNLENGTPSFLGDDAGASDSQGPAQVAGPLSYQTPDPVSDNPDGSSQGYLLSPEQTPSLHNITPPSKQDRAHTTALPSTRLFETPSAEDFSKTEQSSPHSHFTTPDTSDDSLAASAPVMSGHSPRVMVSMYGKDGHVPVENLAPPEFLLDTTSTGFAPDDAIAPFPQVSRDPTGRWMPDSSTGQGGIGPSGRLAGDTASVNDLAATRIVQERNQGVQSWLSRSGRGDEERPPSVSDDNLMGVPSRAIPLGNETENLAQPGRTYYVEGGSGSLTQEDIEIMRQNRNWEDAPTILPISSQGGQRYQPESSADAMRRFENMCRDNDSVVSRAATWGTRRRSLPSIVDMEGIVSGNFLKKLSISRGEFLKDLRSLVRRPSASNLANLKRSLSSPGQDEDIRRSTDASSERRQSRDSLAPPGKSVGWSTKRQTPSINTALVGMGSNIAAIGTTHARSGSISSTTPIVTPKSPFTLKVANITRRRAKSDLPRLGTEGSFSNIADMWKKTGGPPAVVLSKAPALVDQDDDDDEDDELDDNETSSEAMKFIDDVTPNLSGFQQHILKLNPMLDKTNSYLVERIAHQQVIRFKTLCNAKIKHAGLVQTQRCQAGPLLCVALGGSAVVLDNKGDSRGLDPLSARLQGSDDDVSTPLEGVIGPESFPQDIPMPPTQSLPAEFECQLCFTAKKFQKPSDWTKHVHEDVQPFTCTWDRCRDPKIFKRKADWVRHENEGHRHLEWWTCDVEDCRHTCYRRDNFLQHLVREHKFSEPKVKTKAAIKRTGALDPTWQRVERCHVETRALPQNEPCRFCGKTFPTWKKLTVHLAKHMEQISLPLLRLVSRKQLDADTIISPVQDPPPRSFGPLPIKEEPFSQSFGHSPGGFQPQTPQPAIGPMSFPAHQGDFGFSVGAPGGPAFPNQQQPQVPFGGLGDMQNIDMSQVNAVGFQSTPSYYNIAVTTGSYGSVPQTFMPVTNEIEPFPQLAMSAPMDVMDMSAAGPSPMQYNRMMDPASAGGGHFTPQGSASPYSRSPHTQPGHSFY